MNKWYLLNTESAQENETHKLLWDFELQTDHLIPTRRLNLEIVNKKKKKKKEKKKNKKDKREPAK